MKQTKELEPQHVVMPVDTFNAVTAVLSALPYNQVAQVMAEIQRNAKLVQNEEVHEQPDVTPREEN